MLRAISGRWNTSLIELRDYQREAVDEVLKDYHSGSHRLLIHLPTGSGKTIVMAAIAKELNKNTLVIAHREELINQAVDKFRLYWDQADIGVCMAEQKETGHQVIIGSVQSCSQARRLKEIVDRGIDVLLIDEAHHAASDSYQKIISALGFGQDPQKLLIGVTATPMRSDNKGLCQTFDKLTYSRSIGTMIKAGYLAPVIGRKILTSFVLGKVRTRAGDFSIDDLASAINTPERNDFVAAKYKEHASDRKGVAFCADVQHCKDLAQAFNGHGITAAAVWGNMPKDERRQALENLRTGTLQVITSCGILTEGFDEPSITCIAMARPTKSKGLYIQCIGRGLRLYPGKAACLVLDFGDSGHNLDNVASLASILPEALHINDIGEELLPREEKECTRKIEDGLVECDTEFDILGGTRFIWIPIGDEWSLLDDEKNEIVISPEASGYTATLYYPDGFGQRITNTPLPLEYCSGVCEDYARRNLKIAFCDLSEATWMRREEVPTQAQRTYLESQNAWDDNLTKAQASLEIRKIISLKNKQRRSMASEPITDKQRYFLNGYNIETEGMSKLAAMMKISELKQLVKR